MITHSRGHADPHPQVSTSTSSKSRKFLISVAVATALLTIGLVVPGAPTSAGPHPAMANAPGPATTGMPTGMDLTSSGSIKVTQDGAVIEAVDLKGRIYVDADNVTIRNSRIDANGTWYGIRIARDASGLVIEDTEIFGARSAAVSYGSYVARRLNVHSSRYGLLLRSNSIVEDSWIHDLSSSRGIGLRTIGGSNSIIRGNYISTGDGGRGAAVSLGARRSPLEGWLVENNVFEGGKKTFSVGSSKRQPVDGIQVVNNVWVADSWLQSPTRLASPVAAWYGNASTDGDAVNGPDGTAVSSGPLIVAVQPSST